MEVYGFTAQLYFISFILTTSFLLVNIAIAILLDNMTEMREEAALDHADVYYAEVTIRGAVNLPAMDLDGSVDPYCEVRFIYAEEVGKGARPPDHVCNTSVLKETFDPVWQETFICPGKPQWVEITMCDKDFGLGGFIQQRLAKLERGMGLTNKVNKQGDDIIGVQRRNFVRMFELLHSDDAIPMTELQQFSLPMLKQFPKRNSLSSQNTKDNYVYKDNKKKDITTITLTCRTGRNPSSNKDTIEILKEVKRSEKRLKTLMEARFAEMERKVASVEADSKDTITAGANSQEINKMITFPGDAASVIDG